ncbi:ABC transporter substrate-binding protein [Acidithiobacillus sp. HP-6]|uniref:ABC transporter substrate-binding protein n=1 Tax=unclassified Acidithiobacillus TaxID=2614800 RepID=UPI00187A5E5B|nr:MULTISPECIES: ABC transporter substrate-binding protein [unclassified Acidithiobacillus]MBE7563845.1 ABC transporter substrate-binding protein [Acidithiobacillus sp. HP-6]MBE7570410.1 ABC transporter substrate-binding protein [Acidithiobacillus sp. HP-2]
MLMRSAVLLSAAVALSMSPMISASAAVAAPASAAAQAKVLTPKATIDTLDAVLLKAMQGGSKMGYQGRYAVVSPVVRKVYDFDRIASLTLGNHWSKLTPAQQKEFVGVLADYTAATYAARFDNYEGEHFAVVNSETMQPGTEGVFSTLTMRNGKVHHFDYLLQQQDGQWRIVNVVADGVSDLSLKRSEYDETIKSKGFPALIAHLKAQIAQYASGRN